MPKPGPKFTLEEDKIIREIYAKSGSTPCKKLLPNRNSKSIRNRAKRLGVVYVRTWSEEEDCYLSGQWGYQSIDKIAKYLGRTKMECISTQKT